MYMNFVDKVNKYFTVKKNSVNIFTAYLKAKELLATKQIEKVSKILHSLKKGTGTPLRKYKLTLV